MQKMERIALWLSTGDVHFLRDLNTKRQLMLCIEKRMAPMYTAIKKILRCELQTAADTACQSTRQARRPASPHNPVSVCHSYKKARQPRRFRLREVSTVRAQGRREPGN